MRARLSDQAISPQKTRLVADLIRGQHVERALDTLNFTNKKAAKLVRKLLESAIANAENNHGEDIEELFVKEITVDQAATLKRFRARAKGRGNRILKRRCHINILLASNAAA